MRWVCIAALMAAACGGDDEPKPMRCPFGDASLPAQVEIVHLDAQSNVIPSTTDALLPLGIPPQGGWAVLLGVRVTNVDGCQLNLTTSFRDLCDSAVLKVDSRPSQPLVDTGDGWGVTPLQDFSNLQLCPAPTALRNLFDQPFLFTVSVEDIDGKRASEEIRLAPTCPAGDPRCSCECDQRYIVGGSCPPTGTAPPVPSC